ncbi:9809_t:CDS:1, partial [Racocetra persica]
GQDYIGCDCNDDDCELCQLGNNCTLNDDCASGTCHSVHGICVACTSDSDCNDEFRCMIEIGVCICKPNNNAWSCQVGDSCVDNKDCETGTCSVGICVACYHDNECDPGNECVGGFCICKKGEDCNNRIRKFSSVSDIVPIPDLNK